MRVDNSQLRCPRHMHVSESVSAGESGVSRGMSSASPEWPALSPCWIYRTSVWPLFDTEPSLNPTVCVCVLGSLHGAVRRCLYLLRIDLLWLNTYFPNAHVSPRLLCARRGPGHFPVFMQQVLSTKLQKDSTVLLRWGN